MGTIPSITELHGKSLGSNEPLRVPPGEGLQPSCTKPIVFATQNSQKLEDKAEGVAWKKQQINYAFLGYIIQTFFYLQEFKDEIIRKYRKPEVSLVTVTVSNKTGDLLCWYPNPWDYVFPKDKKKKERQKTHTQEKTQNKWQNF